VLNIAQAIFGIFVDVLQILCVVFSAVAKALSGCPWSI
jgi:hypothetical protein